ncbi:MFS transporter [Streptomyces sp. NPDC048637]|uniref:MFS transporter n=1 Tax=Streptomyces sp. NPDC048637 TaxID=3155636 RepID=UPI0034303FB7
MPSSTTVLETPAPAATYRNVLGMPDVLRLLVGAVVGHLPVAMAPLAILLVIRTEGGTVSDAAMLAAMYGVSTAVAQPLWGRMLDSRGHLLTLAVTAGGSTMAFTALAVMRPVDHLAAACVVTAAAGLATPPLEAALRTLWSDVTASDGELRAVLALDASAQEVVFIVGPVLVLVLDVAADARLALASCALIGLAGSFLFATTPPVRRRRHTAPVVSAVRPSPLRASGPRVMAAALFGAGAALGAVNVAALTFSELHHNQALSTLIPAALAVGSLTGGLLYGRRAWPGTTASRLLWTATGIFLSLLPLLAGPGPIGAVAAAALPGLFLAPLLVQAFAGLDHLAPLGTLGEAAAWLVASLGLGQAAGTALAGSVGGHGPWAPVTTALSGAALACIALAFGHRTLTSSIENQGSDHPVGAAARAGRRGEQNVVLKRPSAQLSDGADLAGP